MIKTLTKLFSGLLGGWQSYAAAFALGAALAALPTWYVTDAVMGRTIATMRVTHADEARVQADAARASEAAHRALETALWGRLAAIQDDAEKEAQDAKAIRDRLRSDVDAGRLGLWIHVCLAAPTAGSEAGADPAAAASCREAVARLSKGAERAYFDLARTIDDNRATLRACQADAAAIRATLAPP